MKTSEIPTINLTGPPRQRGRLYGEAAKPLISAIIKSWKSELGRLCSHKFAAVDPNNYVYEFLSQSSHLSVMYDFTPQLVEEIRGIAEGAGQTFEDVLCFQLIDEEWGYGLRRNLNRPTSKCTAFALRNPINKLTYAGQNMDIGSWVDGKQLLLRLLPDDGLPEALLFSIAGNTGLNGLNARGVGVTCNTLSQFEYSEKGLPVGAIVRTILTMNSTSDAEYFLRSVPHASGQNYLLSSANDLRCFECNSKGVVRYTRKNSPCRVFHTNHPLSGTDESPGGDAKIERTANSIERLRSISTRLGETSQDVSLEEIKAALSAHDDPSNPVSRNTNIHGDPIGFTAGSSIYEFGDIPRLHLAAGPPCETEYELFDFGADEYLGFDTRHAATSDCAKYPST